MFTQVASSSSLPELPPEIWLKIFQIATFIPYERDLPATTFESGLFCSYDAYQISAFERVLPLRLSIVLVSRRFYQIGAEVLYTAFHTNARINNSDHKLSLFSDLLVSRPELGRFIRRLSLWWSDRDEENNYRIISRCPNVVIFSSFAPLFIDDVPSVPWWRGLPKTIRSFDADVCRVAIEDILGILRTLPHLEMLHLWDLQRDPTPHPPICLTALRILSAWVHEYNNNEPCSSLLSTMQLPRLTALVSNVGVFDGGLSFPLDLWRRLEYFKPSHETYNGLRSDYFHNLRHLSLTLSSVSLGAYLVNFPFHQLECLTLQISPIHVSGKDRWKQSAELALDLPLNTTAMPKLKLLQLIFAYTGIYEYYCDHLRSVEDKDRFILYFESLTASFERRGVLFAETNDREVCPGFQPICDVLNMCKRSF